MADDIKLGLEETLAYAKGEARAAVCRVHDCERIDASRLPARKPIWLPVDALGATLIELTGARPTKGGPGYVQPR